MTVPQVHCNVDVSDSLKYSLTQLCCRTVACYAHSAQAEVAHPARVLRSVAAQQARCRSGVPRSPGDQP
jgi:hypothetical protein